MSIAKDGDQQQMLDQAAAMYDNGEGVELPAPVRYTSLMDGQQLQSEVVAMLDALSAANAVGRERLLAKLAELKVRSGIMERDRWR
jgi:hypothetical protein